MRGHQGHGGCSGVVQGAYGLADGAGGVDHVVHHHAVATGHIADDAMCLRAIRARGVTGLVDEGQRQSAELGGPLFGDLDTARVGGNDGGVLQRQMASHVVEQHRHGGQVVHRAVEEALLLRGVQVHGHDAVGTGGAEQVEDQAGGDRLAALMLLVLAGVAHERADGRDGAGGGAFERVDHDELLHHPRVDRFGVRLHHEHVGAAHRLGEADVHLAVRKVVGGGFEHGGAQVFGGFLGLFGVGTPRHQRQSLIRCAFENRRHVPPFSVASIWPVRLRGPV